MRRADLCVGCGAALPVGTRAEWDPSTKSVTCTACVEVRQAGDAGEPTRDAAPVAPASDSPADRGVAGASARRRYDALHQRRRDHVRSKLGKRIGGLYLALSEEPQSTRAWGIGSRGERELGEQLETLHDGETIYVLHDRRVPRSRANLDHLVVCRSGVHVIDAKNYEGKVQRIDRGGWFSTDLHLYVGRRDCTKLIGATQKQVEVVKAALNANTVPVHGSLCFVDAEWSLFAKPFTLDGIWVGWIRALGNRLRADGPLNAEDITALGATLAQKLPPA